MIQFTFHPKTTKPGSSMIWIDVEKGAKPFGRLWTFKKERGCIHPWHAKAINGAHKAFYPTNGGLEAAKVYITQG